jgi:NADH:ubiquinone oxidoreductase subunit B-like Fe-S oxidoreductase
MISAATSKHDMDRFGRFPFRASLRQATSLTCALGLE